MKIVKLSDGLGNQMFQYAFARTLQKLTGDTVLLDRSWFPEFGENTLRRAVPRPFALGAYDLPLAYATQEQADMIVYGRGLAGKLRHLLHRRPGLVREGRADLSPAALARFGGNRLFRGFFQSASYPAFVRTELLEDFALPPSRIDDANRLLAKEIAAHHSVAVHIRRGDYMKADSQRIHGLCPMAYYAEAEKIICRSTEDTPRLYLFSDDPDWVRGHYETNLPFTVVDVNDASQGHLDIYLMSRCRHAVIANSTFSWWGAWLIEAPGKIVVAPRRWFADGRDASNLIPSGWHLL